MHGAVSEALRSDDSGFNPAGSEIEFHDDCVRDRAIRCLGRPRVCACGRRWKSYGRTTKASAKVMIEPMIGFDQKIRTEPSAKIID